MSTNPVLLRLLEQRTAQTTFVDQLLARVAEEDRDLVEAERSNLTATRERIAQLDEQIEPLEAFESIRSAHQESTGATVRATHSGTPNDSGAGSRSLGVQPRTQQYRSPGHFVVDYLRAAGDPKVNRPPNADAAQRVAASLGRAVNDVAAGNHVTTVDTPGLLPEAIVGEILTEMDGSRPFINSVGIKELSVIPGKTFERPRVTESTQVQEQTAEKGELVVGNFHVEGIPFVKRTFGGALNVSRQDIDWTSPSAWNSLITDLQFEYSEETEDVVAASFAAGVLQVETIPLADEENLTAWIKALYLAAVKAATANGTKRARARRLPNMIWTSIDMWASLGAVIDSARTDTAAKSGGEASPLSFAGSVLDVPRVMVPGFTAGTVIVGRKEQFEFYEERIGLLQAIEPKVLGVEVAYGGYAAWGNLDATAFAKLAIGA